MNAKGRVITMDQINEYVDSLQEQERAESTVNQYKSHLLLFVRWLDGRLLTKQELIYWTLIRETQVTQNTKGWHIPRV